MVVSRWGNSLGVRLPRALVDSLGLKPRRRAGCRGLHGDPYRGGEGRPPGAGRRPHARPRTVFTRGLWLRPR